jgi:hypothetical protein
MLGQIILIEGFLMLGPLTEQMLLKQLKLVIWIPLVRIEFNSLEKVVEGKFVGEGVKRTPAFETTLPKNKFEEWRSSFWRKRI